MLLLVGLAFFRLGALDLRGFSFAVLAVAALVVLALVLALFAVSKAWGRGDRGGGRAVAALFLATILAMPFALGIGLALEYPNSNMAATDGIAPDLAAGELPIPVTQSSLLLGRDFRATAAEVYSAARSSIEASGWEVVEVQASAMPRLAEGDLGVSGTVLVPIPTSRDAVGAVDPDDERDPYAASDSDQYTITAVAYTPIFGFASDVTVRIAEVDGASFVDVRSASRELPRDLGQNRRFIEGFFGRLEAAMNLLQSGPVEE